MELPNDRTRLFAPVVCRWDAAMKRPEKLIKIYFHFTIVLSITKAFQCRIQITLRWKGGWGAGHPDPEIRGAPGLQRIFFGPSGLNLVYK